MGEEREVIAKLLGALAPFAAAGEQFDGPAQDEDMAYPMGLTVGDLREAKAIFHEVSRSEGLQPVSVKGEGGLGPLGASKAPSCGSPTDCQTSGGAV